ncbi:MAG TPA: L,D-transpeptidase [Thermoanaerobaculia bacterium]|nr:L,D-transpeptidase [Thermoanaerobaculia bacterium]
MREIPRWIGLLGSWALLVLGAGLATYAVAAEAITISDATRLRRVRMIDSVIAEKVEQQLEALRRSMDQSAAQVSSLESEVSSSEAKIEELQDPSFVITVSTAENKVYARREGDLVFDAVCSTGKNTTLRQGGRTMVFRTPIGKFRVISKETDPVWVPPDWHFIEEAQNSGLGVVRLERGDSIGGLYVQGNNVMRDGIPLPPGRLIVQGGAVIIPPIGTRQRQYADVLGTHRLNLGDGYALHGTQAVSQLGRSVSHGCIRLHNDDIARLYQMASVGDQVVIY